MVVVGGGIAGLTATYEARKLADRAGLELETTILEAGPRVGGKLFTERKGAVALEWGADSFVAAKSGARELANELGLEVVPPGPRARRAYVLLRGEDRKSTRLNSSHRCTSY